MTYKGCVSCYAENTNFKFERGGFDTVADATKWVGEQFTYIMLHWGEINENIMTVHAEVCNEGEENSIGFTDYYELRCGY